jgi:cellulose synthase/poly-beta-1,6-N-acetylglucosamine synthase-like glycosyltransferase
VLIDVPVPGNRWDLLAGHRAPRPRVGVVVVHYEQHAQLARTLAALREQTLPPVDVVVADDGSATLPDAGVRVVTQPDRGFRAAAARNRGVRHVDGEVLVFLDADTVPEPRFLEELTCRVALCPDVLAVGRRRHRDPGTGRELPEPAWLRDAYAASRDLLDADGRSFRFVISAVMACRRGLFEDVGGFDERFVGYGGEDWDLAYRAWNAGGVLVHERGAVAWHDGPDWAGRPDERERKSLEAQRLAELIPEPHTRGAGARSGPVHDVLVDLAPGLSGPAAVRHALEHQSHRDLGIRSPGQEWTPDQLRRARVRMEVRAPLPRTAVAATVAALVDADAGCVTVRAGGRRVATATTTRAVGRARRWAGRGVPEARWAFPAVEIDLGAEPDPRTALR